MLFQKRDSASASNITNLKLSCCKWLKTCVPKMYSFLCNFIHLTKYGKLFLLRLSGYQCLLQPKEHLGFSLCLSSKNWLQQLRAICKKPTLQSLKLVLLSQHKWENQGKNLCTKGPQLTTFSSRWESLSSPTPPSPHQWCLLDFEIWWEGELIFIHPCTTT